MTNDQGSAVSSDDLTVTSAGVLSNRAGTLQSQNSASLTAATLDNTNGSITTTAQRPPLAVVVGGAIADAGGIMSGNGALQISAGAFDLGTDGQLLANDDLS